MPIFEYKCKSCEHVEEHIIGSPAPEEVKCVKCDHMATKLPSFFGSYSIKGNNSASETPKKFRGGRRS